MAEPEIQPRGGAPGDPHERRRRAEFAVVVGLSLIGLVAAAQLLRRPAGDGRLAATGPVGYLPKPEPPALNVPTAAEPPSELSFGRLMEILGAEAENPAVKPVADAFTRKFMAEPELKKTYEDFKDQAARGGKPTAGAFFAALKGSPAFGRLAASVGHGSGGSAAVMTLAQHPEVKRFLSGQDSATPQRESGITGRRMRAANLKGGALSSYPGGTPNTAVQGAGAVAARGPGGDFLSSLFQGAAVGGAGAQAGSGAPGAIGGGGVEHGGGTGGGESGPTAGKSPGGAEPGAGTTSGSGTTPLGPIGGTCSQQMDHVLKEWLGRYQLDPRAFLNDRGSGIWDKCFKDSKLRACDQACHNQPRVDGSQVNASCQSEGHTLLSNVCAFPRDRSYWETCKEAGNSEEACLKECKLQSPPCQLNPDAVKRLCYDPLERGDDPKDNCAYTDAWEQKAASHCGIYCMSYKEQVFWLDSHNHSERAAQQRWLSDKAAVDSGTRIDEFPVLPWYDNLSDPAGQYDPDQKASFIASKGAAKGLKKPKVPKGLLKRTGAWKGEPSPADESDLE